MDKIAVLIPCYNESKTIEKVVKDFQKVLPEAVIYVYDNNGRERRVDEVKTIADARKSLLKYAATYGGAYVKKEYVKVKGNNVVMEARTRVKKVKTKPKTIPKNAKLEIIHKYYFFGWVKE